MCPDCQQVPTDSEVIGCENCGQWTHNNCQQIIDPTQGYICLACRTSDLQILKETIFDKQAALSNATQECRGWKQKFDSMAQAQLHTETMLEQTTAELTKIQKKNVATAQVFEQRMNTQRQQFKLVSEQKNAELSKLRSHKKRSQHKNANLTSQVQTLRKREREHDGMVKTMEKYVKRHKNSWSYTPPSGLGAHDLMLWGLYQCKVRSNNDTMLYSANKISSTAGDSCEWNSLTKTLQIARKLYKSKK